VLLLGWVFLEQLGLPIPSIPLLLAAGALAGAGRMNMPGAFLMTVTGALAADLLWYELGRRRGIQILRVLCKISLEPDSCVRRTEGLYAKHGTRSLIVAKFLPGLSTVAPPLAGIFHVKMRKFLLYDALGASLWAGTVLGLGFVFSNQIEILAAHAERLGTWLAVIVVAAFGAYLAWKLAARKKFLRELRIARITPEELKLKMEAGEDVVIVDLRHSMDFEADPETIPGAFRMEAGELEKRSEELPRDREVILFCT
jgi:membrane protein DedA with SNARE-associated domain